MIKTEYVAPNILKIVAPKVLRSEDFLELAPTADALIKQQKTIRLFIDASKLNGWTDVGAVERHMMFVKTHQRHVERIAVITQHEWQHWFVSAIGTFLHPEVRAFTKENEVEAMHWLSNRKA